MGEYEVVKMNNDTWRFEDNGVRFFLLNGKEKSLLIDTGMSGVNVKECVEELTNLPILLINTHTDIDHIGGNREFDIKYLHPAELYNYEKLQGSIHNIIPVWDGDTIDLGDRIIKIIHIPGHTPGSIALLDLKYKVLYGGDSIQDGNIFLFGSQRNIDAYRLSLKRINEMKNEIDYIYPSHGSIPVEFNLIEKLIDGTEKVINGIIKPNNAKILGQAISIYDIGVSKILGNYVES